MQIRKNIKDYEPLFKQISRFIQQETEGSEELSITKPEYDGVTADPCHHTVIYKDEYIKILSVSVPPGVTEKFHTHELPAIMYVDKPCDIIVENKKEHKQIIVSDDKQRFMFIPQETLHAVTNTEEKRTYYAFRFEINKSKFKLSPERIKVFIESKKKDFDSLRECLLSMKLRSDYLWRNIKKGAGIVVGLAVVGTFFYRHANKHVLENVSALNHKP